MNYRKASVAFFVIYFIISLFIFKDYGVTFDDSADREYGVLNWDYIFKNDPALLTSQDRFHGPAFEMLLFWIESFHFDDSREIYLQHHYCAFIFFYLSVIAFFFTAKRLFGNEKWALVACLILVLSPRIFADAFYNTKDIGFLSAMIFSFYTLLRFIDKPNFIRLALHCLATAFAIDIRLLGVLMIPVAIALIAQQLILQPEHRKKHYLLLPLYLVLLTALVILFWPILWHHPLNNFIEAIRQMGSYPWGGYVRYCGKEIVAPQLPWHYLPVWVFVSTPLVFTILWLVGVGLIAKYFISNPALFLKEKLVWGAILFLCIAPVLVVIILKSVVYDAWRHVFFIYPFFVLIAVYGLTILLQLAKGCYPKIIMRGIAVYLLFLAGLNAWIHPFQNTYFNFAVLPFKPVEKKFDIDYWGLSYKQGLEYILKINPGKTNIKVKSLGDQGIWNVLILTPADRKRINFNVTAADAEYYLSNHRWEWNEPPAGAELIYDFRPMGYSVQSVYRLNKKSLNKP